MYGTFSRNRSGNGGYFSMSGTLSFTIIMTRAHAYITTSAYSRATNVLNFYNKTSHTVKYVVNKHTEKVQKNTVAETTVGRFKPSVFIMQIEKGTKNEIRFHATIQENIN